MKSDNQSHLFPKIDHFCTMAIGVKGKIHIVFLLLFACVSVYGQPDIHVRKKDRRKDIEFVTTEGSFVVRLYDSTPLHRDNFIRLIKSHFYDSLLFHRVIKNFMVQTGDPASKNAPPGKALGDSSPSYTVPPEFRESLFHYRGVLGAARESDDINPQKLSSSSQFYIVQGKKYTDSLLDSVEIKRLKRKIPFDHRTVYKNLGGTPWLDQNYTVFGEVVRGMETIDKIASEATSKGEDADRPITDVRILNSRLIKRKSD